VNKKDVVMLPKDTVIAELDGTSKQMHIVVDTRMNVDEMQNALDELLNEAFRSTVMIESIRS
jgi:hypothetical protein